MLQENVARPPSSVPRITEDFWLGKGEQALCKVMSEEGIITKGNRSRNHRAVTKFRYSAKYPTNGTGNLIKNTYSDCSCLWRSFRNIYSIELKIACVHCG